MRIRLVRYFLGHGFAHSTAIALISIACTAYSSEGALVEYSNRALWQASAGASNFSEDFNSFVVDTPFRIANGPLALNGFTLVEISTPAETESLNLVDLPPLINITNDVNGTPFASIAIDFGKTSVELRFNQPTSAFGADFRRIDSPEVTVIDFFRADNSLLATIDPTPENDFIGYVATGGEAIKYVRFHTTIEAGSGIREAFGLDNVEIVTFVPEPSTAVLAACIFAHLASRRRRRR